MTQASDDQHFPSLFTHSLRKEWGVGVLAWEAGGKRGYLFEDGQERTLAGGYHELMCRVEQLNADQTAAYARLQSVLGARRSASSGADNHRSRFVDQVARLRQTYPAGLLDPKWVVEVRGEGAEKRAANHRQALIEQAQEQLSCSALDALLNAQRFAQIWTRVIDLLAQSDLVPPVQLKKAKSAQPEQQRTAAIAIRELLHGKAPYDQRFERYIAALAAALGEPARWELATALSAIVHPSQHVCVQITFFRQQLKSIGSRETAPTRPGGSGYAKLQNAARVVANKLADQGEMPRDLMDVHDFIRITLKPAAKAKVAKSKPRARNVDPDASELSEVSDD